MPADRPFFRRHAVAAAVLALAAAVVATGLLSRQSRAEELRTAVAERALPIVKLVTPAAVDAATLELPARLEAWASAPIHARVGGYLKRWTVDIGSPVRAGQLLAEIETPELDEQLLQARAELATARSQAALAESTAQRWQRLLATDAVSRQEADERAGELRARQSMVQGLQANVDRVLAQKQYARLVAPFDGVVTARNTDVGALVSAGGGAALPLFVVADMRRLRAYVQVPQRQVAQVRVGTRAQLVVPERPSQTYAATVQSLAQAIQAGTGAMLVQMVVDNRQGELLPGSFARLRFDAGGGKTGGDAASASKAIGVPPSALIIGKSGVQVATLQAGDRVRLQPVVIARDLGTVVELSGGLASTDRVIDSPPDGIADGEQVRVAAATTKAP